MSVMGRPKKYNTPEEMQKEIDKYFDSLVIKYQRGVNKGKIKKIIKNPTISGLCLFLGFESRQSFYDYEKVYKNFSYTIKTAKLRLQEHYEHQLNFGGCAGAIFALKNFGWKDERTNKNLNTDVSNLSKQEIESLYKKINES